MPVPRLMPILQVRPTPDSRLPTPDSRIKCVWDEGIFLLAILTKQSRFC
ncbi:MAG: hypothetical protein F6K26_33460 [Moorea sp. SIO2I5]|nr:hypothetical protein [Moorena sp. SIO2I5]